MMSYYVYLKTGNYSGTDLNKDTIPLRVTNIGISSTKTIPAIPIPLSGIVTGESLTAALDLGMATKNISLSGFIVDQTLTRTMDGTSTTRNYTAHEIAQLLHSSVDSTGLAPNQAISELVILIPSKVNEDNTQVTERNIPFTFRARGLFDKLDNLGVPAPNAFPTSDTSTGLTGFVRSLNTTFTGDTVEVEFNMEFEVAIIAP